MTTHSPNTNRIIWLVGLIIIILGLMLPLSPLAENPMHPDEALYARWASLIARGEDVMLNSVPVDKPPLFIYSVALAFKTLGISDTIARIPSLIAHIAILALTIALGHNLYSIWAGLLAGFIVALSPFAILFAPTALTDPMMVAFVLFSALMATRKKPVWAGVGLALATATKQQGLFFLPLILGLLVLPPHNTPLKGGEALTLPPGRGELEGGITIWLKCLITFGIGLAIPLLWDMGRSYSPGFWLQSSLSYGPVDFGPAQFSNRLAGFITLLGYGTASPLMNLLFPIGLVILLGSGWLKSFHSVRSRWADWLLALFCLAFIILHAVITFQIWDRYLLGLIPLLALLLARILLLPLNVLQWKRFEKGRTGDREIGRIGLLLLMTGFIVAGLFMAQPARQASQSAYPIGGDHGAYYGTAETTAYLRQHVDANVTLYHRWLGTHWRYYLADFPYDLRFWDSADMLAEQAAQNAHGEQYIAFPPWESNTLARLALANTGLKLQPVYKTYRPDGSPGIFLYRIVLDNGD